MECICTRCGVEINGFYLIYNKYETDNSDIPGGIDMRICSVEDYISREGLYPFCMDVVACRARPSVPWYDPKTMLSSDVIK